MIVRLPTRLRTGRWTSRRAALAAVALLALGSNGATTSAPPGDNDPSKGTQRTPDAPPPVTLAKAKQEERDLIERLRHSRSWVRRAFAAERLGRFDCEPSLSYLQLLVDDDSWRVRCFAVLAMARRGVAIPETRFAKEPEQRVIRTILRCRYTVPKRSLVNLAERLARSERLDDKLMALELALAGKLADAKGKPDPALGFDPIEILGQVILRMDRVEAGSLSPRLAAITKGSDSGRNYKWREWFRKHKRDPGLDGAFVVVADPAERDRGAIAALPLQRIVDLEVHMQDLSTKPLELAIALDCTASMSGELAECQSGIDSLMLFAQDVAKSARIGIVGYRDEQDDWETKGWDLTASLDEARDHLWQLSADGGGDRPESVLPALKLAYTKMRWQPDALKSVIVVGDAPPRPGTGELCVDLARRAFGLSLGDGTAADGEKGIKTYTIAPHAEVDDAGDAEDPSETIPAKPTTSSPKRGSPPREPESTPKEPPPATENPSEDPRPENNRPGLAPWTKPAKKPVSPWRQKLKPGQVEYWKEIAEAGGGRTVGLPRDASLMAEIAGLTLGDTYQDEFESFFQSWIALCR